MASIGDVGSIDARQAARLRKAGVRTTESLLRHAATRKARASLSEKTGIPAAEILAWAHRADLMRVRGIGGDYAEILAAVGIATVGDLGRRDPEELVSALAATNREHKLVKRIPSASTVAEWVAAAAELDPIVSR